MLSSFWRHNIVGNDTAPWLVALTRAVFGGAILGGLAALAAWNVTDNPKEIAIPALTAFLTYVGMRFGIEGTIDQRKNGGPKGS